MRTRAAIIAIIGLLAACGGNGAGDNGDVAAGTDAAPEPVIDVGDRGQYDPQLDPADFVPEITNPYLPFLTGSRWVYEGTSDGEEERVEVVVLDERKTILGIEATVVRDTVTVDGELVEDTLDWFAQDREGNVWYLGEDVKDYEDGEVVSTDGSFEAGVGGAKPGIVMPADPTVGHAYRQEYFPGEAEDVGEILRLEERTTVPFGTFDDVLVTRDWNPLEPEAIEEKHYAPGVGLIFEEHTRGEEGSLGLVEFRPSAPR